MLTWATFDSSKHDPVLSNRDGDIARLEARKWRREHELLLGLIQPDGNGL
jgi:hypothetical protein